MLFCSHKGVLGWDIDLKAKRAWLHGPFLGEGVPPVLGENLIQRFMEQNSSCLQKVDGYYNVTAKRSIEFLRKAGFADTSLSHVYVAQKQACNSNHGGANLVPFKKPAPLAPQMHLQFEQLHTALFPNAYLSSQEILQNCDREDVFFAHLVEVGMLVGYIYVSINPGEVPEGYVDFLAVAEGFRGRGYAEKLLNMSLHWIFDEMKLPQAALSVDGKNVNARSLYEKVGFSLLFTGQGLRWEKSSVQA